VVASRLLSSDDFAVEIQSGARADVKDGTITGCAGPACPAPAP
jgi:hypothetical protein